MKHLVFFGCIVDADGTKRYTVRIDPSEVGKTYDADEYWQLMLDCFSASSNGRENFLAKLDEKQSIPDEYVLSTACEARLGWTTS